MSRWNHAICVLCWNQKQPDHAISLDGYDNGTPEKCCYCGNPTQSGILYRSDSAETLCDGQHGSGHAAGS